MLSLKKKISLKIAKLKKEIPPPTHIKNTIRKNLTVVAYQSCLMKHIIEKGWLPK